MLVPEAEFEAQMAAQMAGAGRALTPEAMAGYFAQSPLNGVSPYGDPVYLEDIQAPEPDVRIGHMCIDNPCMVILPNTDWSSLYPPIGARKTLLLCYMSHAVLAFVPSDMPWNSANFFQVGLFEDRALH